MTLTPTPTDIKVYHTQGKDNWGTATPLYQQLDKEFEFNLDVCADVKNHKCATYLTEEMDALSLNWWGRVFMNPPFTQLDKFLYKLINELLAGHIELAVALIASRTDTQAMFTASSYAGETRFLKGRVAYEIYPTDTQRIWCSTLQGIIIEPGAWAGLTKEIGLPKTAILALIKDPSLPDGDPKLAQVAPFPSTVMIFDKRKIQSTVYWDWKKGIKTAYFFGPKAPGAVGVVGETTPKIVKPMSMNLFGLGGVAMQSKLKPYQAYESKTAPKITPSLLDIQAMEKLHDQAIEKQAKIKTVQEAVTALHNIKAGIESGHIDPLTVGEQVAAYGAIIDAAVEDQDLKPKAPIFIGVTKKPTVKEYEMIKKALDAGAIVLPGWDEISKLLGTKPEAKSWGGEGYTVKAPFHQMMGHPPSMLKTFESIEVPEWTYDPPEPQVSYDAICAAMASGLTPDELLPDADTEGDPTDGKAE